MGELWMTCAAVAASNVNVGSVGSVDGAHKLVSVSRPVRDVSRVASAMAEERPAVRNPR